MVCTERQPTADELAGMTWWNNLDEPLRRYWLWASESSEVWQAWKMYQRHQALIERIDKGVIT